MRVRTVPTSLLVALCVIAGLAIGLASGLAIGWAWPASSAIAWFHSRRPPPTRPPYSARANDPVQWRVDSALLVRVARLGWATRRPPREVRRVQALNTCAVSFAIRDTTWRHRQLFNAQAWDRLAPGRIIARGYAYRDGGFDAGDTATVVLPDVWCGDLLIGGYGAAAVFPSDLSSSSGADARTAGPVARAGYRHESHRHRLAP